MSYAPSLSAMAIDTAWALSGGGANGAWQNGFLQRLLEAVEAGDLPEPDAVIGTSVGSLNASAICQFPKGQACEAREFLDEVWGRIDGNKDIYKPHLWGLLPSALLMFVFKIKRGLNHTKPLQKTVRAHLDLAKIEASGRHFACNAIPMGQESESRWFETGDPHLVDGVLASAAYPIFFEPVKIEGKWYTDGGIRDTTPLGKAIELGAKNILSVSCSPQRLKHTEKAPKGLDYLLRTVEIMLDEVDRSDFQTTRLINELVKAGAPMAIAHGWRLIEHSIAHPAGFLGDSLDFSRPKNTELRTQGWAEADQFLRTL